MTPLLIAVLCAAMVGTSFLSGIFGMAGGLILVGILLALLPLQDAMVRILRRRFGPLPEEIETRVRRLTDSDRLAQLVEDAATISDLPEGWPGPT